MSEIRVTSVVGENGGDRVGLTTGLTVGPLTGTTGIGATITHQGHAQFAGVCTATSFSGSGANLTGISAGITMAQQWRLRVITTVSSSYVTLKDWEICDSLGSSSGYGGNMTLDTSSGVWTFPSTGIYHLNCQAGFQDSNNNQNFLTLAYNITTNNSSYTRVTESYGSFRAPGYENISAQYLLDVTDVGQVKVKFQVTSITGSSFVKGNAPDLATHFTFIRVGDT